MRLYVMRHGETDWNRESKMCGLTDLPLNENGIKLAEYTRDGLKGVKFDLCICSPLKRARMTADIILEGQNVPIITDKRIQEIFLGDYEGRVIKTAEDIADPIYNPYRTDTMHFKGMPGGGESIRQVLDRTGAFLDEVINTKEYEDKTILVSSHGCAYRAMLHRFYPDPDVFWHNGAPRNCSISVVESHNGDAKMVEEDVLFYDPSLAIRAF